MNLNLSIYFQDVGGRYELNGKEGNDGKRRGERDKRRRLGFSLERVND